MSKEKLMNKRGFVSAAILAAATMLNGAAIAAPVPDKLPTGSNPEVQMNQSREYMESQRVLQRIEKEKQERHYGVEGVTPEQPQSGAEVKLNLNKIAFDKSEIFTEDELVAMAGPYLQREVSVAEIYELVDKINKAYQEKGYYVCRAFLPQQDIIDGVLHITIVEGRTGNISVAGNKSTKFGYITDRIKLEQGKISNLKELNDSLIWFNGTNDVQLRVQLQAGTKPGTTDYQLTAYEPRREQGYVLFDTAGSDSTGIWREGVGWYTRSLSGNRDMLSLSAMRSDGTISGAASYSVPISKSGTKLGLQYSANKIKIKHGDMSNLNIKGRSSLWGVELTQPLVVRQNTRINMGVSYNRQDSQTDFMGIRWMDDSIDRYGVNVSMTNYGKQSVLYQKHSYFRGKDIDIAGESDKYGRYNLDLLAQRDMGAGELLTFRGSAQVGNNDNLPSADQFYIGGGNSVRGYKENILSGDSGYNLSLEYSIPESKTADWVYFLDYGNVSGKSAFGDHKLMSVGMGYKFRWNNQINSSLMLGVPLDKTVNGQDIGSYRLHFSLYGMF